MPEDAKHEPLRKGEASVPQAPGVGGGSINRTDVLGAEAMATKVAKAVAAAVLCALGGGAWATGPSSKVDLKNAVQLQAAGTNNRQVLDVGNVKGGGGSDVRVDGLVQLQAAGTNNRQTMDLGGVTGEGSSKVQAKNVVQLQAAGSNNRQSMTVGTVRGGGSSDVRMTNVVQLQAAGANNAQAMNVGNVSK